MEYQYNLDGVRVSSTVNGEETRYLIDTNRPYAEVVEEYTPGQTPDVSYVHGIEVISQTQDSKSNAYLYDGHSGARQLTDETGQVTDSYTFDAYGNVLDSSGTTENNYLYRGEQDDPNVDLQYLRARYYDTDTGRFISTDPFVGWQEVPISRHRYVYGNNNPISYIDPSGRVSLLSSLAAIQVNNSLSALAIGLTLGGSQRLAGFLAAQQDGTLNWSGRGTGLALGGRFGEFNAIAGTYVEATSEVLAGRATRGKWAILSVGYAVSVLDLFHQPWADFNLLSVPLSVESPAYFEPRIAALGGGFLQLEANHVFGAGGLSFQAYTMGYGVVRSDATYGLWNGYNDTFGYAPFSVGAEFGFSIPIYSEQIPGNPTV
ncbi:MAG: RHS repeat-associated core domain-containing protein [Cyanothece sp. SIO2G6]|nr:RHS repeat-associated core domain-containing protein [Cyanothece sp. SIO2G6]